MCLEVADRQATDTIVVASGFGTQAPWYQNLQAHRRCRVSIGARVNLPARARFMSEVENEAAIERYREKHPIAWRRLRGTLEHAIQQRVDTLPMVELSLD